MRKQSSYAVLPLVLAGCASSLSAPPPAPVAVVAPIALDLPRHIDAIARPALRWIAAASVPLAIAADRVFVTDRPTKGDPVKLRALSLADGASLWTRELTRQEWGYRDRMEVAGDRVLIFSSLRGVLAFSTRDGARLFEHRTENQSDVSAVTRTTVALCIDGKIDAFDLADGHTLFRSPCRKLSGHGDTLVATLPGESLVPTPDDPFEPVVALDARTGRLRWSSPLLARKIQAIEGLVLLEQKDALTALALDTGAQRWSLPGVSLGDVQLADGRLIHAAHETISALDPATGATRWSVRAGTAIALGARARLFDADARTVLFGAHLSLSEGTAIVRLDAASGRPEQVLGVRDSVERLWLRDGDAFFGSLYRTARFHHDRALPPLDTLHRVERLEEHLDALIDDPLGNDRVLSEALGGFIKGYVRTLFVARLSARIATLPEQRLLIVLPALRHARLLGTVDALVARFPAVRDPEVRADFIETFAELRDGRATAVLGQALGDAALAQRASEALVGIGTHDALARVATWLDARTEAKARFLPCAVPDESACPKGGADKDGDGWSDALEAVIGTAPDRADSDGDGVPDASDPCPRLPGGFPTDDLGARMQAAFLAVHGRSTATLFNFSPATPVLCLRGAPAPIVHQSEAWSETWRGSYKRPLGVTISLEVDRALTAPPLEGERSDVTVGMSCGPLCGRVHIAHLVFREGRWFCENVEGIGES